MKNIWWKAAAAALITYSIIGGLLSPVPRLPILNETIRNLYYHVPMWFGMMALQIISCVHGIYYLRNSNPIADIKAAETARASMALGLLGLATGMVWAKYTWGEAWHGDPKQNGSAIALLVYAAYFILRASIENDEQRARLSAVYNIFAFMAMFSLLFVLPRLTSSMHPGSGGNPGFNMYDLNNSMRPVFYAAVVGWILMGCWMASLCVRVRKLQLENEE